MRTGALARKRLLATCLMMVAAACLGGGLVLLCTRGGGCADWLGGRATLEGWLPPESQALGDWLEAQRRRRMLREVYLRTPEETLRLTALQAGLLLDVGATLGRMRTAEEAVGAGLAAWWSGEPAGSARDVAAVYQFDAERARATLQRLAPSLAREPVDAHLDLRRHLRSPAVAGRRLDVEGTLQRLRTGLSEGRTVVDAAWSVLPPRVTSSMLAQVDVSQVLASFETSFLGHAGPRAVNIAVAARYLDGSVIGPGETFSFNDTVGARTLQRGFVFAPVIVEDELEPGVGGGVCQVATSLHAAAVFGWLDIVRRRSHSRPSGYASLGLDATVIDGEVDLQIRNPYQSALIVHAFLPAKYTMRVELLGHAPPGEVTHSYSVNEKKPFHRRLKTKDWLDAGAHQRKQKGHAGYDVTSHVSLLTPDGQRRSRSYASVYYPVPEVYWVGPSQAARDALPPLPEHATHSELDGEPLPDGDDSRGDDGPPRTSPDGPSPDASRTSSRRDAPRGGPRPDPLERPFRAASSSGD